MRPEEDSHGPDQEAEGSCQGIVVCGTCVVSLGLVPCVQNMSTCVQNMSTRVQNMSTRVQNMSTHVQNMSTYMCAEHVYIHVCRTCLHVCRTCLHVCRTCLHMCRTCLHVCRTCLHVCRTCLHTCVQNMSTRVQNMSTRVQNMSTYMCVIVLGHLSYMCKCVRMGMCARTLYPCVQAARKLSVEPQSGWIPSWLYGYGRKSSQPVAEGQPLAGAGGVGEKEKPQPLVPLPGEPPPSEEEEELLDEMSEAPTSDAITRDRILATVSFDLKRGSFELVSGGGGGGGGGDGVLELDSLLELKFSSLRCLVDIRPRLRYSSYQVSLGSLVVSDPSSEEEESAFGCLIQPKGALVNVSGQSGTVLCVLVHKDVSW